MYNKINFSDRDEHSLIAQYCAKLLNGDYSSVVPDSPMQVMEEINRDQTQELELMIRELESENATLQEEYNAHLKASASSGSNSGASAGSSGVHSNGSSSSSSCPPPLSTDAEILNEAKLLREHKERLESRMRILEEHNQQLVSQLGKLKMFMVDGAPENGLNQQQQMHQGSGHMMITANKTGTLNTKSVTASQLATNSPVMTHRMVGGGGYGESNHSQRDPPALPPRGVPRPGQLSREGSVGKGPPAVPPKRSSLTRSELALFDSANVSNLILYLFTSL